MQTILLKPRNLNNKVFYYSQSFHDLSQDIKLGIGFLVKPPLQTKL